MKKRSRRRSAPRPLTLPFRARPTAASATSSWPRAFGALALLAGCGPMPEIDATGGAIEAQLESQCGPRDDSQDVEKYDGKLGVSQAFVKRHERMVGRIEWREDLDARYDDPGIVSGSSTCSGTLISADLFLTAGHCFAVDGGNWIWPRQNGTTTPITPAQAAREMVVRFDAQLAPSGSERPGQTFPVTALVEHAPGGLDFALLRLGNAPGDTYGRAIIARAPAASGERLVLIGHPEGLPKRVAAGAKTNVSGAQITYADIDTLGGSSGSGLVQASTGALVGVHAAGGCDPSGGANRGVSVTALLDASPTLAALARDAPLGRAVFGDEDGNIYAVDGENNLRWYKHAGRATGTFSWSPNAGAIVRKGWSFARAFAGDGGVIYAIDAEANLRWYKHEGRADGSDRWAKGSGAAVSTGWRFEEVFSGGDGVIYAVTKQGDLRWYRHDGRADGTIKWAKGSGGVIGRNWIGRHVFAGADGTLYLHGANGKLRWYKHAGRADGSATWAAGSGATIGSGFEETTLFPGAPGVIYGIAENRDLTWRLHEGHRDGSTRWADGAPKTVGTKWGFEELRQ